MRCPFWAAICAAHATALCVCTGQQRRKLPAEPTSPEAGGSCTGANNVVQAKLAAWAEECKGRGAQRERHTATAAARTAAAATACAGTCNGTPGNASTRPGASTGGCLAEQCRWLLVACRAAAMHSSPSGNIARVRSEAKTL